MGRRKIGHQSVAQQADKSALQSLSLPGPTLVFTGKQPPPPLLPSPLPPPHPHPRQGSTTSGARCSLLTVASSPHRLVLCRPPSLLHRRAPLGSFHCLSWGAIWPPLAASPLASPPPPSHPTQHEEALKRANNPKVLRRNLPFLESWGRTGCKPLTFLFGDHITGSQERTAASDGSPRPSSPWRWKLGGGQGGEKAARDPRGEADSSPHWQSPPGTSGFSSSYWVIQEASVPHTWTSQTSADTSGVTWMGGGEDL